MFEKWKNGTDAKRCAELRADAYAEVCADSRAELFA
jgi:hypothetical protein